MSMSPEAVWTFRPPSVPRAEMSADLVRTDSPESCGQRMRHSMPLRPKIEIEKPRFCGTSTRIVGRCPCGFSSIARVVDEPLRLLVVRDQLDLDASVGVRVDLDVAAREAHVELDRALDVECLLHLRLL